ncbi:MAG: hypothetical protein JW955_10345 [Sedimentisphaerales bacterium]|nr:hypothetical protein [Sedimentisphaerales bacterium]
MRFGDLDIDPAVNPAILDTVTWDARRARDIVGAIEPSFWHTVRPAGASHESCELYRSSRAEHGGSVYFLGRLPDRQHVFIRIGAQGNMSGLGDPLYTTPLGHDLFLAAYAADAAAIRVYVRDLRRDRGPRAMGSVPRLGIGTRMSTSVWPGIWRAMDEGQCAANAIQNSVRELNLLEDVLAGRAPRSNYLYGFGTLEEGHTGSTFEGLWVAGVIEALKTDTDPTYGADADHITVRRGPGGLDRAKRIIDAARDYTFFTLDVSDLVDYTAADSQDFPGKYRAALDVVEELSCHIKAVKGDVPFDLELSVDECPPRMAASACLTTEAELTFLTEALCRRGVPMTHVAPNVGIVKGQDYDAAGLAEFERRLRRLDAIAADHGVMLDIHSGDDLSPAARQAIGRATGGRNHFKVSPSLQVIFAKVLWEFDRERFRLWWDDTLAYARREAAAGSEFAAHCLHEYASSGDPTPSPHHAVFHHYNFASVGRRDEHGRFVHRESFYNLPADFYRQYHDRIAEFLRRVADDVFGRR